MIQITCKKDGFRRCGIAHSVAATEYADDRFSDDELKALAAEPMLMVVSLPDRQEEEKPAAPKKRTGTKTARDK